MVKNWFIKRVSGKFADSLALPLLVAAVMMICSVVCQHGGVLYWETEARLPYYLSQGSLPDKIYDSDYLDAGMFQARELSYFFDYLDSRFIAASVRLGHPHFISLTQYVFLILISLEFWRFGVRDLKVHRGIVLGVLLLFWTAPSVFWGGAIFRTSKIGVSLALVVLYRRIFLVLREAENNPDYKLPGRTWLACSGWAWAATLFDRQGVFMVGTAVIFLGFQLWGHRQKSLLIFTGAFAFALALSVAYNHVAAPALTLALNGYWPDFKYQDLPWPNLAAHPLFFIASALSLYFDTLRFFIGNPPVWLALAVLAGISGLLWKKWPRAAAGKRLSSGALGFFLSQTVLMWLLILLMVLRHAALLWPDVKRVYYFLPLTSMFAMTLLLAFSRWPASRISFHKPAALFLGVCLAGNLIALPGHRAILSKGDARKFYDAAPALLQALGRPQNAPGAVAPEIATNRVYQFFHDGHFVKYPLLPSAPPPRPRPLPAKKSP